MPKLIDLANKKFGRLTAIKYIGDGKWLCECKCGAVRPIRGRVLRRGGAKSCGCSRMAPTETDLLKFKNMNGKSLIGKRFGKLVATQHLGRIKNSDPDQYWVCKCDCGNEKIIRARNLANGNTRSCGCASGKLPKGQAAFNQLRNSYKRGAKTRNLSFELSDNDFRKITSQKCFYCGVVPAQSVAQVHSGRLNGDYIHNGVDRIDNMDGYTTGNCVPCCKSCNYFKGTLSMEGFIKNIERIYNHTFC